MEKSLSNDCFSMIDEDNNNNVSFNENKRLSTNSNEDKQVMHNFIDNEDNNEYLNYDNDDNENDENCQNQQNNKIKIKKKVTINHKTDNIEKNSKDLEKLSTSNTKKENARASSMNNFQTNINQEATPTFFKRDFVRNKEKSDNTIVNLLNKFSKKSIYSYQNINNQVSNTLLNKYLKKSFDESYISSGEKNLGIENSFDDSKYILKSINFYLSRSKQYFRWN